MYMQYVAAGGAVILASWALRRFYFRGTQCDCPTRVDNKIIIITGANTGIGFWTAVDLAKRGGHIILACRNLDRTNIAAEKIKKLSSNDNICVEIVDLSSFTSIKEFADRIKNKYDHVDILINNAGVFCHHREMTEDGVEKTMGTNHLGHFLLTKLLLHLLTKSPQGRVINVSSRAYKGGRLDWHDMNFEENYNCFTAYSRSKLANILFTRALAERIKDTNVTVYALHPGHVKTDIMRNMREKSLLYRLCVLILWPFSAIFMKNSLEGAQTTIHAAVNEDLARVSGVYLSECKIAKLEEIAENELEAKRLWYYSEDVVRKFL